MVSARFASGINEVLRKRGLSQTWLAKEIEMKQPQLSRYLSGKSTFPTEAIEACLNALNMTVDEILAVRPPAVASREDQLKAIGLILGMDEKQLSDTLAFIKGDRMVLSAEESAFVAEQDIPAPVEVKRRRKQ